MMSKFFQKPKVHDPVAIQAQISKNLDFLLKAKHIDPKSDKAADLAVAAIKAALEVVDRASEEWETAPEVDALFTDLSKAVKRYDEAKGEVAR